MRNKKIIQSIMFLIFLSLPIVEAAGPGINIEHTGYGKTNKEVYIGVYNTGEVQLTDMEIWVDGVRRLVTGGRMDPGKGFETIIFLDSGEHFIEVKTPEGAYDSLNMTTPSIIERPYKEPEKEETISFLEKNKIWIVLLLILAILIIVFFLLKKPRLKV